MRSDIEEFIENPIIISNLVIICYLYAMHCMLDIIVDQF